MKKLRELWPFLIIIIIWIILFWPFFSKKLLPIPADIITGVYYPWLDYKWGFEVGVPVKNPLMSDIPSLLYPWRSFAIDELKAGRWPLWNPYYFLGMPLLANFQSAVFSYINIFFLFLPKALAWSAGVMTSPLLTMLAMYFFLQHKKLNKISSLFGGIVFSLSGFEVAWMEYNVHGHTALFLPLILLSIDKILDQKKNIWLYILSIFVAFQFFAGYVPLIIYCYLICFFYVLFFYLLPEIKQKKIFWKKYLSLILFWSIGLGIALIQILPGLELTILSIRKIDPIVLASNASYLPIRNLITFIAPDFFGNPATGNFFGSAYYDNYYLFIGTGTLIFVIYSLFFIRREKNVGFWAGMTALSFILIFKNPVGLFLEKILFLSGGVAARAIFITDFSLAILSAYGFDLFFKNDFKDRRKIVYSIILVAVSSLFCVRLAMMLSSVYRTIAYRNLAIPILVCFFCSLILLIMIKFSKNILLRIIILLIISFQLLYSTKKYLPFSKNELLFPATPVLDFLIQEKVKTKEPFRVELGEVIPQNFLMPYGIETTSGYDALLPLKTGEFLSLIETGHVDNKISRVHLLRNYQSPYFKFTNTKYILAKKMNSEGIYSTQGKTPDIFNQKNYKNVFEDKTVVVFENENYLPRVNFVNEDMDISKINKEKTKTEWLINEPLKREFAMNSNKEGFVLLLESIYPGWRASVNSKPVSISSGINALKLIPVAAGKNVISIEYKPDSFHYGKIISVFSLFCWGIFLVVHLLRKRK